MMEKMATLLIYNIHNAIVVKVDYIVYKNAYQLFLVSL